MVEPCRTIDPGNQFNVLLEWDWVKVNNSVDRNWPHADMISLSWRQPWFMLMWMGVVMAIHLISNSVLFYIERFKNKRTGPAFEWL